MRKEISKKITI